MLDVIKSWTISLILLQLCATPSFKMSLSDRIERFFKRHSFFFNVCINVGLVLLASISYALIFILFLKTEWLGLESLVYVQNSRISPTVAIGLLVVLLSGATATMVTRAVEHGMWLKLVPREMKSRLTVSESRKQAQWSVSSWERVKYFFTGKSWLLKFGGILLLGTAALNPVLLAGVTPRQDVTESTQTQTKTQNQWVGFTDAGNEAYNGGMFSDTPMTVAALASMYNLSSPGSGLCQNSSCSLSARMASLQAECTPYTLDNPTRIGVLNGSATPRTQSFCSKINPEICTSLNNQNPVTYVNFTSGPTQLCDNAYCPGEFCTLFGVWTNSMDGGLHSDYPVNVVDCSVRYGNVTVTENSNNAPQIVAGSFVKSDTAFVSAWQRIYFEDQPATLSQANNYKTTGTSPYTFAGADVSTGANTLYEVPLGALLLNYAGADGSDANGVAVKIQKNFEMSTLFAFAKAPDSADVSITTKTSVQVWRYDAKVLAILVVPFLASLLVMSARWRVGDCYDVVGYDPVEIAKRGPVIRESATDDSEFESTAEVWAVKRDGGTGTTVETRLVVG